MTDTDLDVEARVTTALRTAAARGADPTPDLVQVVGRARRRRTRATAIGGVVALLVVTASVVAIARTDDSARPQIRSGTDSTTPDAAQSVDRPVLDQCMPSHATELTIEGGPFMSPVQPFTMFADPAQGAVGPLAAFWRTPSTGAPPVADGAAGGLRANSDIDGRDLNMGGNPNASYGGSSGANWDLADGGHAYLQARGVHGDDLRALVEALDRDSGELPLGLVPIGTAGRVEASRSDCTNDNGMVAAVTTYRGDEPSRWAQVVTSFVGASVSIRDDGETTTLIVVMPGAFDAADATVRQATPEEWAQLIDAGKRPPWAAPGTTTSPTVHPSTTTTASR